jgi:hypothetical protein
MYTCTWNRVIHTREVKKGSRFTCGYWNDRKGLTRVVTSLNSGHQNLLAVMGKKMESLESAIFDEDAVLVGACPFE